jgi:hypothetical protein
MRDRLRTLVLVAALGLALAGCTSSPTTTPTSPPAGSGPTSATGDATAQIKTNWEAFFNPKTPNAQRAGLLQNGDAFTAVLAQQAANPLASAAQVVVSTVTVTSPTQASVVYSINVNGTPALPNQQGVAVLDNGVWKVSTASFCALLTLEAAGNPAAVPAACSAAPTPSAS